MRKVLVIFSLLMFLPNIALAQSITYLGIENEIIGDAVNSKLDITFSHPNADKFVFPVYASVSNFNYNSSFGAECSLEKRTYGFDIVCSLVGLTNDKKALTLNFTSTGLIRKDKSQSTFTSDVFIPTEVSTFFYQIILPPGAGLPQNPAVSPEGWKTASPDGRRIFLFWNRNNLAGGHVFSLNIVYEQVFFPEDAQLQFFLIGGFAIAALLSFLLWKRKSMLQVVLPILKDDEKRIFEALMKHGSGTHQRMIVKESNYSKAKVSKVLKSLEQRGLIRLERIGRSNKVHMIQNFTKKSLKEPGNN